MYRVISHCSFSNIEILYMYPLETLFRLCIVVYKKKIGKGWCDWGIKPKRAPQNISFASEAYVRSTFKTREAALMTLQQCLPVPVFSCPTCARKIHPCLSFNIVFPLIQLPASFLFFPYTLSCRFVFGKPEDLEM